LLDGSGVEEVTMGFEVGVEQRNAIRGWVCGRWGTPFLKCRGGGKFLARKWAGGWKKEVGTKVFCTDMEGTKNIYCKFDGKKERRERNGRFTRGDYL
jgi:hypothetical protein